MKRIAVEGYEGQYEVQEDGKVFSVGRVVKGNDGTMYPFKARELKPHPNKNIGYLQLSLWKNNKGTSHYVHRLVARAFVPNPDNLPEVNHKDGNRQNNHYTNLEWVDSSGNSHHAVQSGLRVYTNRLTRNQFIECLQSVIAGESYQELSKRVPYKVPFLSTKLRKLAREEDLEDLLNQSLHCQKVERARKNGVKNQRAA